MRGVAMNLVVMRSAEALTNLEFPLNPFAPIVAASLLPQRLDPLRQILNNLEKMLGKLLLFTPLVSLIIFHVWPFDLWFKYHWIQGNL